MLNIFKSFKQTISVSSCGLTISSNASERNFNWLEVKQIRNVGFLPIKLLKVKVNNQKPIYGKGDKCQLRSAIVDAVLSNVDSLLLAINAELSKGYPSEKFLEAINASFATNITDFKHLIAIGSINVQAAKIPNLTELNERIQVLENIGLSRKVYVESYISRELITFKDFFDTVEKTPLTEEQRTACVVCDDRQLLVAAAGSGKSSTLVAKVGYMLEKGWITPNQVVALAFNKDAASELLERCEKRLSKQLAGSKIRANTFHRFGLDLSGQLSKSKPSTSDWATDDKIRPRNIHAIVMDLISENESYARGWNILVQLNKAKDIKPKVISGKDGKFRTLQGELVASREEVNICDFLFVHGIEYEYERPYELECSDDEHRQYKPDFYYPSINVYHEHFAIDANGNAPKEFKGYLEKTEWRRNIHKSNCTRFFETTSAEFPNKIYETILYHLREFGYDFDTLKLKQAALGTIELDDPIINEIDKYLKNRRSSIVSQDSILSRANTECPHLKDAVLLAEAVISRFDAMLHSDNSIDYSDMIKLPTKLIRENPQDLGIRMILIDEFQDLSPDRADLINTILDVCPGCKLFGVGDDWQAINGFAGSDLQLMLRFHDTFGKGTTQYLTKTFRSNQGICDVAKRFVTTNPDQLKKSVDAVNKKTEGVVEIHYINSPEQYTEWIEWLSGSLSSNEKIYALARYNAQLVPQKSTRFEDVWGTISDISKSKQWGKNFQLLSFHKSKGLEADTVIILSSLDEDKFRKGFPTTREDSAFVQLSTPPKETYFAAEERRLFYVALTRAKSRVIIPAPTVGASPFIEEIIEQSPNNIKIYVNGIESEICPKCKRGAKSVANGKFGEFLCCTRFPECNWKGTKEELSTFGIRKSTEMQESDSIEPEWLTRLAKISKAWIEHCFIVQLTDKIPMVLRVDPKHEGWDIAAYDERHPSGVLRFELPRGFSRRFLAESYEIFTNWAHKARRAKSASDLDILNNSIKEYFSILEIISSKRPQLSPTGVVVETKEDVWNYLKDIPTRAIKNTIKQIIKSEMPINFLNKIAYEHPTKPGFPVSYSHDVRLNIYDWLHEFKYATNDEYTVLKDKVIEELSMSLDYMVEGINSKSQIITKWNDAFRLPENSDEYLDTNLDWESFAAKDREWQLTAIRVAASVTYRITLCSVCTFIDAPDDFDIIEEAKSESSPEEWRYWTDDSSRYDPNCVQNHLGPLAWRLARMQGLV